MQNFLPRSLLLARGATRCTMLFTYSSRRQLFINQTFFEQAPDDFARMIDGFPGHCVAFESQLIFL
jgi:hypothetical protein